MHEIFESGKLKPEYLKEILKELSFPRSNDTLIGPSYGEDAGAFALGDKAIVVASDPITFTSSQMGYYLVNVNANDIATMGAKPKFLLLVMLLPEKGTDPASLRELVQDIKKATKEREITVLGGHTEITPGLERPILVGTMIGVVDKDRLVTSSGAREGDALLLTEGIAIEGTSIIAREKREETERILGKEKTKTVERWLFDPGISVVKGALILSDAGLPTSMHDPTEGGLAMGIHELCEASEVGALVYGSEIPIFEETRALASHFGIDPLGLIASGALLFTVHRGNESKAIEILKSEGINAKVIGEIRDRSYGVKLEDEGKISPLPRFEKDEILKVF